jgi:hypothetical protein
MTKFNYKLGWVKGNLYSHLNILNSLLKKKIERKNNDK